MHSQRLTHMNANTKFTTVAHLTESGRFVTLSVATKICICAAISLLALQSSGHAQVATTPKSDTTASATAPLSAESLIAQGSSHISEEELPLYIDALSPVFVLKNRTMDPFGQVQDTTVKKIVKNPEGNAPRRFKPIKPTSFSEVIGRIKVTTIMPSEQKFLIGTRSFKKGDAFPLGFRGRTIDVAVIGVTAQKIDFENTKTGEVASLKIKLLPDGMQSGTSGTTPPGMAIDDNKAPLQVGPAN